MRDSRSQGDIWDIAWFYDAMMLKQKKPWCYDAQRDMMLWCYNDHKLVNIPKTYMGSGQLYEKIGLRANSLKRGGQSLVDLGVELPWGVSVNKGGILSYFNKHILTTSWPFFARPNWKLKVCRMWIKKILNVNIINFEKVDKPEGGGSDNANKVFCKMVALFNAFFAILIHI